MKDAGGQSSQRIAREGKGQGAGGDRECRQSSVCLGWAGAGGGTGWRVRERRQPGALWQESKAAVRISSFGPKQQEREEMGRTKSGTGRKWWRRGEGSPGRPSLEMLRSSRTAAMGKSRAGTAEASRGKELKKSHEFKLVSGGNGCWEHWERAGHGN